MCVCVWGGKALHAVKPLIGIFCDFILFYV